MYLPMNSLFLQDAPAETSAYMIAGYAVIFGVMLIYLISLAIRRRNLKQDLEVLQELERGEKPELVRQEEIRESSR